MRLCPRVRYHKDGTASLHGIPASDLKSLLVAASLHRYDSEKQNKKARKKALREIKQAEKKPAYPGQADILRRNLAADQEWHTRQRNILKLTDDLADAPRQAEFNYSMRPLHTLKPFEIQRRIKDAKDQAAFRKKLTVWLADIPKAKPA